MLGDVRFKMFAWGFDTFLLGDEFFECCAWGCGFQGLVCLGTSISAPLLLGDLLGGEFAWVCVTGVYDTSEKIVLFRVCLLETINHSHS